MGRPVLNQCRTCGKTFAPGERLRTFSSLRRGLQIFSSPRPYLLFFARHKTPVHASLRNIRFPARMNYLLIPKNLRPIAEKVEARQRISEHDALDLYRSNDLN